MGPHHAYGHHAGHGNWEADTHGIEHGPEHFDIHDEHHEDFYPHDVEFHHGKELIKDIEHEYDELFHEIEAHTKHGVEHHETETLLSYHSPHDHTTTDWHEDYHLDTPHTYTTTDWH